MPEQPLDPDARDSVQDTIQRLEADAYKLWVNDSEREQAYRLGVRLGRLHKLLEMTADA